MEAAGYAMQDGGNNNAADRSYVVLVVLLLCNANLCCDCSVCFRRIVLIRMGKEELTISGSYEYVNTKGGTFFFSLCRNRH